MFVDFYFLGKLKFKVSLNILIEIGKLFSACL
jgi:hypothetical protein